MERLIKSRLTEGYESIVAPGAMKFLGFGRLKLAKGQSYEGETGPRELVGDAFAGEVTIRVTRPGQPDRPSMRVGSRKDVFSGPPAMFYLPPRSSFRIEADSEAADLGLFSAPSEAATPPAVLADVTSVTAGKSNWQRTVYTALGEKFPAGRLLAGETLNPPGNWSSYPPHKHDRRSPPSEIPLEEVYFFRIDPPQGFGFIWTYTAEDDENGFSNVFVLHDGDTVLLPKGYHPVVAAPGYRLHYTWVLAGDERRYGAWADDPRHSWVKNA
jgi:5-deoxy-glucuronate isomerase